MSGMTNIHKEITIPNRIFLKGLDILTKEDEIYNIFIKHGSIIEVKIIREPVCGESKGFGFVTFDSQLVAESVLSSCKLVEITGREVMVGPAKIRRKPPSKVSKGEFPPMLMPRNQNCPPVPYSVSPDGLFTFYHQPCVVQAPIPAPIYQNHNNTYIPAAPMPRFPVTNIPNQSPLKDQGVEQPWSNQHQQQKKAPFLDQRNVAESNKISTDQIQKFDGFNGEVQHSRPLHPIEAHLYHFNNHIKKPVAFNHPGNQFLSNQNFSSIPGGNNLYVTDHQPIQNNFAITWMNGVVPSPASICCLPITTIVSQQNHIQDYNLATTIKNEINRSSHVKEILNDVEKTLISTSISSTQSMTPIHNHHHQQKPSSLSNQLKDQKFVFMSTGLGKVKRVVVQG